MNTNKYIIVRIPVIFYHAIISHDILYYIARQYCKAKTKKYIKNEYLIVYKGFGNAI